MLKTASRGTSEDTEKHRPSDGHLLSGDPHREGQVKTWKETDRARGTHFLDTASGGTSQDTERNRPSEGHSLPGDRIGRDKSGYGKKQTERGALTSWRPHRQGQVRMRKETDRARGTHKLETASAGTNQDTGRNRPSEGHSQTGDRIGRDKSGHEKKR